MSTEKHSAFDLTTLGTFCAAPSAIWKILPFRFYFHSIVVAINQVQYIYIFKQQSKSYMSFLSVNTFEKRKVSTIGSMLLSSAVTQSISFHNWLIKYIITSLHWYIPYQSSIFYMIGILILIAMVLLSNHEHTISSWDNSISHSGRREKISSVS